MLVHPQNKMLPQESLIIYIQRLLNLVYVQKLLGISNLKQITVEKPQHHMNFRNNVRKGWGA